MTQTIPLPTLLLLGLALSTFLVAALLPYQVVSRVLGRAWVAAAVGSAALVALVLHIAPHVAELVEELPLPQGAGWVLMILAGLALAGTGYWFEGQYHTHEEDALHQGHQPETSTMPARWSQRIRMVILAAHAGFDGHAMAELGLGLSALPFLLHKFIDGVVVNGDRTHQRAAVAWRLRIAIQLIATTLGVLARQLIALPEWAHVGIVMVVIGIYLGSLQHYAHHHR